MAERDLQLRNSEAVDRWFTPFFRRAQVARALDSGTQVKNEDTDQVDVNRFHGLIFPPSITAGEWTDPVKMAEAVSRWEALTALALSGLDDKAVWQKEDRSLVLRDPILRGADANKNSPLAEACRWSSSNSVASDELSKIRYGELGVTATETLARVFCKILTAPDGAHSVCIPLQDGCLSKVTLNRHVEIVPTLERPGGRRSRKELHFGRLFDLKEALFSLIALELWSPDRNYANILNSREAFSGSEGREVVPVDGPSVLMYQFALRDVGEDTDVEKERALLRENFIEATGRSSDKPPVKEGLFTEKGYTLNLDTKALLYAFLFAVRYFPRALAPFAYRSIFDRRLGSLEGYGRVRQIDRIYAEALESADLPEAPNDLLFRGGFAKALKVLLKDGRFNGEGSQLSQLGQMSRVEEGEQLFLEDGLKRFVLVMQSLISQNGLEESLPHFLVLAASLKENYHQTTDESEALNDLLGKMIGSVLIPGIVAAKPYEKGIVSDYFLADKELYDEHKSRHNFSVIVDLIGLSRRRGEQGSLSSAEMLARSIASTVEDKSKVGGYCVEEMLFAIAEYFEPFEVGFTGEYGGFLRSQGLELFHKALFRFLDELFLKEVGLDVFKDGEKSKASFMEVLARERVESGSETTNDLNLADRLLKRYIAWEKRENRRSGSTEELRFQSGLKERLDFELAEFTRQAIYTGEHTARALKEFINVCDTSGLKSNVSKQMKTLDEIVGKLSKLGGERVYLQAQELLTSLIDIDPNLMQAVLDTEQIKTLSRNSIESLTQFFNKMVKIRVIYSKAVLAIGCDLPESK
jgi:hypothetical protein